MPFQPEWMTASNIELASLNKEQVDFLKESVSLIGRRGKYTTQLARGKTGLIIILLSCRISPD